MSFDSSARKKIENLKRKVELVPIPSYILQLNSLPDETPHEFVLRSRQVQAILSNCTITLGDHVVTYTLEEQPFGLARHLSVHVDSIGTRVSRMAIKVLMEEFGFRSSLGHCLVYEEAFKRLTTVNVVESLEPSDSFWKMVRTQSRPSVLV